MSAHILVSFYSVVLLMAVVAALIATVVVAVMAAAVVAVVAVVGVRELLILSVFVAGKFSSDLTKS